MCCFELKIGIKWAVSPQGELECLLITNNQGCSSWGHMPPPPNKFLVPPRCPPAKKKNHASNFFILVRWVNTLRSIHIQRSSVCILTNMINRGFDCFDAAYLNGCASRLTPNKSECTFFVLLVSLFRRKVRIFLWGGGGGGVSSKF